MLSAAVGSIVLAAGAPAATAADFGSDGLADLEERVAELEATTARKGNRRVSLIISGQVHTALLAWDNGVERDVYIVDVPNLGGTLFNFSGNAKISPSLTAGFLIQVGLDRGARAHQVSEIDDDGGIAGDGTLALMLANWYLDHARFGRLTLGRINTATSGITGIDLGGVSAAANVDIGYWNAGFIAQGTTQRWGDLLGGPNVFGSTISRANAVSYTSPILGGFSVQTAWGENDIWDAALRYAGELGGFRIAAGIGYANNLGDLNEVVPYVPGHPDGPSLWKGSASVLHVASGLFVNASYINRDNEIAGLENTTLWFVQGGIARNWTGLGNTALYGEYGRVDNSGADGSGEADVWGLGIVQHIDAAAMEVFLSYRQYSGEYAGVDADSFDAVLGGARIRF